MRAKSQVFVFTTLFLLLVVFVLLLPRIVKFARLNAAYLALVHDNAGAELNLRALLPEPAAAYGLGLRAMQQGNFSEAENQWVHALAGDVHYLQLVRAVAPTSKLLAERAAQLHPAEPTAWTWLAELTEPHDALAALENYERAAQLDPANNLIWERIGVLANQAQKFNLAFDAAKHACDLNPKRNGSCHTAARLAYQFHEWQAVVDYFVRGSFPEHAEDWVLLIRAAEFLGRTEDAQRYLARAQDRNPAKYDVLLKGLP